MTQQATTRLINEAQFIDRYTRYYRRQFAMAMQENKAAGADMRCIRMCLEALSMIDGSQQTLVAALGQVSVKK